MLSCLPLPAIQNNPIRIEDYRAYVALTAPQISPDGNRIVVVETRQDWSSDKNVSALEIVNLKRKSTRQIASEYHDVASPKWATDSKRIAFLSSDLHGASQV